MKKIAIFLVAAILAGCVFLCACTPAPAENGGSQASPAPTPTAEPEPPPVKEKIKVYLIAGQSNALGCTATERLDPALTGVQDSVLFYCNGEGAAPGYNNSAAHNKWTHVQPGFGVNGESFGLELGMGNILGGFYPKQNGAERVAIVKYTWGGTGLAKRWLTAGGYPKYANTYEEGGRYVGYKGRTVGDLYAEFLTTVETALEQLSGMNYLPEIAGLAWMQGCDDACGKRNAGNYEAMLRCLISDVRTDLGVENLPVAIGQINIEIAPYGDIVRRAQYKVASEVAGCSYVYTRDLDLKPDDWWHFDSPAMYEMGRRFASQLVQAAEKPVLARVEQTVFATSVGAPLIPSSATARTLPAFAEAQTETGAVLLSELHYGKLSEAFAVYGETVIEANVSSGEETMPAQVIVSAGEDPVVDGDIVSDAVWKTCRAVKIGDKGSYIKVYAGREGVYLGGNIKDTSVMNQWYDGTAWDPYLENDQIKFYLHVGDRSEGRPDAHSFAFYITASNVLRVYRGREDRSWDGINHYGRYEPDYYGKLRHKVTVSGTPFNATEDVDDGYQIELFVPYESLGVDRETALNNLKINCAYEDKRDYEIPHTTYQLNGGSSEYDDLNLYLPYSYFIG